jgi:nitrite reductase/ring-hydroxylating ferredoxin subunit
VIEPQGPPIVLIAGHAVVQQRLERVARELGAVLLPFRSVAACAMDEPRAVVIELGLDGALDVITEIKRRVPDVPVVGVLTAPSRDLWVEAEARGAELVLTHGTLSRQLPAFLREHAQRPARARRVRVGHARDLEGRLGFLGMVAVPDGEPVALYRVGYGYCAVADRCPHAGAALHEGELEGGVLTCPRHGSQFDVTTGARVRGPADDPLRVYPVLVEQGEVFLEIPEG